MTAEPDLPDDIRQRADLLTARALESSGRYDEAIIALEGILESQAPRHPLLRARIALSRCYRETGDFTRAIEVGEHGLSALEGLGIDGGDEAIQLAVTIAAAYCERGDLGHAIRLALRTVERADAMGSPRARAAAYWQASIFESERGNTVASIPLAEQALALLKDGEDRRNFARLRAEVGIMMLRADPPQVDTAEDYLAAAREELVASSASVVDLAHCDLGLARARLLAGDTEAAAELGLTTLTSTRDIAPAVAAEAASLLGQVAMSTGTKDRASEHYREAVALLTGVGQDRRAAQLWLDLGTHLEILGDADAARDAYRRAAVASGLQMPLGLRANV